VTSFTGGDATRALEAAIKSIETRSSAEVVIAVRRQSARHLHAHVIAGGVAMFVALAYMLFGRHPFALTSILVDPFVVGLAAGAAVELVPAFKRLVTSRRALRRAVERAARATFLERGVHLTRGRTGVLVYVSLVEAEAGLIADGQVEVAWPAEARDRLRAALTAAVPTGGVAFAAVLAGAADDLATVLPRATDDVNELPDALDVHVAMREKREPER
jgi:putative membrane protein